MKMVIFHSYVSLPEGNIFPHPLCGKAWNNWATQSRFYRNLRPRNQIRKVSATVCNPTLIEHAKDMERPQQAK